MHIDDARGLEAAYGATADGVRDQLAVLSPLIAQANDLLDLPGQNPLYGPSANLQTVANGLSSDRRDVAWRIDWLESTDAHPLDATGRVRGILPADLDAAFGELGLTDEQIETAKNLVNRGVRFEVAAVAAGNDLSIEEVEFALAAQSIDQLSAEIAGWTGHPNDPRFNEMIEERSELVAEIAGGDGELARQIRLQLAKGLPANQAVFEGAVEAFADTPLSELVAELETRDVEVFDPVALGMQAALVENLESFTGADAADVNLGIAAMAQDSGLTYNAAVAMINLEIGGDDSGWPKGTEPFEFLDGPISSGEEAAFRLLGDRSVFDEIEHANGGWFGPDGKMSIDDWGRVLANPDNFSPEAVAMAAFFAANPTEWQRFDTARDGVALSGLADGEFAVSDGDGVTSWADVEQYVLNTQLFNTLSAELERPESVLADLDGDGYLSADEFAIALDQLEASNPNYDGVQQALQYALDADLMALPDNRSTMQKIGDGLYTITSLAPGTGPFYERLFTDPGDLFDDQISFAKGAGNAVVGLGQFVYDASTASPLSPGFHLEMWRVDGDSERHRGIQLAQTIPHLANSVMSLNPSNPQFWSELAEVRTQGTWDTHDGVNLATAAIDWETFVENPAEWAGQFAPDVLISIATGGGGAIARAGTTASRITNTARRVATTTRRMPDTGNLAPITRAQTRVANARHWINTSLDELALALSPEGGMQLAGVSAMSPAAPIRSIEELFSFKKRSDNPAANIPGGGIEAHYGGPTIGHGISKHVGLSKLKLARRLIAEPRLRAASTFRNIHEANRLVGDFLANDAAAIKKWAEQAVDGAEDFVITTRTNKPVGNVLVRGADELVPGNAVTIVLRRSEVFDQGYEIVTAYPRLLA